MTESVADKDKKKKVQKLHAIHPFEDWEYTVVYDEKMTGSQLIAELIKERFINTGIYRLASLKKGRQVIIDQEKTLVQANINNNDKVKILLPELSTPLSAMFLGPKAENAHFWHEMLSEIFLDYVYWRKNYFPKDPVIIGINEKKKNEEYFHFFRTHMQMTLNELKGGFPFHSPRYLGHMLSGQTLPSVVGYFAGMLYNSNNVTDEAAPITVEKELQYGKMICHMIGYTNNAWAHICSGGTVANIEALWVARLAQFLPLVIKDVCRKKHWDFKIKVPQAEHYKSKDESEKKSPICDVDYKTLLSLRPNECIYMVSNLLKYLVNEKKISLDSATKQVNDGMSISAFNIRKKGLANVLNEIKLKPVLFVPESMHYSFKKAANILGYGEDAIRQIPINDNFRINVDKLKSLIDNMASDEYIVAVIAVVGTTEEGAVDPVHKIKWMRDSLERKKNTSFWLHVDAAWG
ncbi:MAG: hypothetical protein LBC03_04625, partial [Nitrososphaerota archaeon]|nr:hypothetical protein [Nitrososphaerota archaeon]